jgi:beta-lactamase regulating signal transducer with metallopeptidase domain
VLAHECAHLERHDPAWIALAEAIAAAGAAQPLLRRVVAALRRDAEFICDEAAVRRTRDGRPLVESLALLARTFDPAAAPAPAYTDSPLVERARRILHLDPATPVRSRRRARP